MSPSKLGLHLQNFPPWAKDVVNNSLVEWVKIINPGGDYPFTRPVKVIGRVWIGGDDVEKAYVARGAEGGDAYFERCWPEYQKAPWVTAWEGPNEPTPYWGELQYYNEFATQWVRRMHLALLKTIVGCISVGQPAAGHIHLLRNCLELSDYWSLHEYAQPTMQQDQSWLCLRYRRTIKELTDAGIRVPPLLITEAGIDGAAVTPEHEAWKKPEKGWKTFATREQYKEQTAWYDSEVCKDPIVQMWCKFTAGANNQWMDFDVDEQMAREDVARHALPPPSTPVPPTIPYYHSSRQGYAITDIVLHGTEGSAAAAESWFRSPNNPSQSSAHVIVTSTGKVMRLIPDEWSAHHAGYATVPGREGINPNRFSLGLELEYPVFPATPPWPSVQLEAAAGVVRKWCDTYRIEPEHIWEHKTIDPTRRKDPRNWNRVAFLERVWPAIVQPLPNDEQGTPALLAEKAVWWAEEMQRQFEAGKLDRAQAIRLSLIQLLIRLKQALA